MRTDTVWALTVQQPWAMLIAEGLKSAETRLWVPRWRMPRFVAIHAGGYRPSRAELDEIAEALSVNETIMDAERAEALLATSAAAWPYQRLVALVRFASPMAWECDNGEIVYDWPILGGAPITSPVISGQRGLFRVRPGLVQCQHRDQ